MENNVVMLRLTVGQINRLLNLLGTHPYNVSADLIGSIKSQGDMQIAAAQAQAQQPLGTDPSKPVVQNGNGASPDA